MMRSILSSVSIACVIFATFGFAEPVRNVFGAKFTVTYTDRAIHSAPRPFRVAGYFRDYAEVLAAIGELRDNNLDWCGFGLELLDMPEITLYWNSEDVDHFEEQLKDCPIAEIFYEDKKYKAKAITEAPLKTTAVIWMLVFGYLGLFLIVFGLTLCVLGCFYSAQKPPSPRPNCNAPNPASVPSHSDAPNQESPPPSYDSLQHPLPQ